MRETLEQFASRTNLLLSFRQAVKNGKTSGKSQPKEAAKRRWVCELLSKLPMRSMELPDKSRLECFSPLAWGKTPAEARDNLVALIRGLTLKYTVEWVQCVEVPLNLK